MNGKMGSKDSSLTLKKLYVLHSRVMNFLHIEGRTVAFPELDCVIGALMPDKFHLAMSTNGILLNVDMAIHLKKIGKFYLHHRKRQKLYKKYMTKCSNREVSV
jgi:hypothetical protein